MNPLQLFFSFKGSISRFEYLAGIAISIVITAMLISIPSQMIGEHDLTSGMKLLKAFIYLSILLLYLIIYLALHAKRLRSLQWSQWLLFLFFIPIINLVLMTALIFVPGKTIIRTMT